MIQISATHAFHILHCCSQVRILIALTVLKQYNKLKALCLNVCVRARVCVCEQ